MSLRYDLTRASSAALCAVVRITVADLWPGAPAIDEDPETLDETTRLCLEAFANILAHDHAESFAELEALRTECRVKTRAEYDREIGQMMRDSAAIDGAAVYSSGCIMVRSLDCNRLSKLIEASRSAPEGEP